MPGADDVLQGLDEYGRRVKAAVFALGEHYAARMEGHAKIHAPWTDRTGNARQGLFGDVGVDDDALRVRIAHSVEYGVQLELGYQKRYAILEPTAQLFAPEFARDAERVLR